MQAVVITATEMQTKSGHVLRQIYRDGQHFIVERDGLPIAAIIPIQEYKAWQEQQPDTPSTL